MMFKEILLTLLIGIVSSSSFAWGINSYLTVVNNTDTDMLVTVGDLPFQKSNPKKIARYGGSAQIDLTIGGWELGSYSAPLTIVSDDKDQKLYVQGRVAYYVDVGPSFDLRKYSFLDSLTAAKWVTLDSTYQCSSEYLKSFRNEIVINGTPDKVLEENAPSGKVHCRGLKSSILNWELQTYTPICKDGRHDKFKLVLEPNGDLYAFLYDDFLKDRTISFPIWVTPSKKTGLSQDDIKQYLDDALNSGGLTYNNFCGSW